MHRRSARLMVRKDQAIRNDDILSPARRKHHNLSNIFWSQRLAATFIASRSQHKGQISDEQLDSRVHRICLGLISIKPHHRELGLNLARIHAHDTHSGGDKFFSQALGESPNSRFGCAVDSSAGVRLTTCDGSDIDDIAGAGAVVAFEHALENFLGHVDESSHVGSKHDVHVFFGDIGGSGDTFDQTAV
jgi:hypothetical protein